MKLPLFNDDEPLEQGYWNNDGKYVFTKEYLINRGYCCGNGCKHCPYEYKNVVDEKKRKKLIAHQAAQLDR